MSLFNRTLTLIFPLLFLAAQAGESSSQQRGLEIATKMRTANEGFVGERSEMEMILVDAHGTETVRQMQGMTQEVEGDGDRSLMIFLTPRDVRGTKMLTWSSREGSDDQWLYLPALRRVRRISANNRTSSFMGSEFSFEDLGSQELERYSFNYLRDDVLDEQDVYVIERFPKERSGYSRMVLFIAKEKMNPLKIEYYDRRNELLKVGRFSYYTQHQVGEKNFWRAHLIEMKNVQTARSSRFRWKGRELGVQHDDRTFSQAALSD